MKKNLILLSGLLLPVAVMAQETVEPMIIKTFYALRINRPGTIIGSQIGNAAVYNIATGKVDYYDECELGKGNVLTNDGIAVGDQNGTPVFMKDGQIIYQDVLAGTYWFSPINGITPDGTWVTGYHNNTGKGPMYVPYVASVDASGKVGAAIDLPYPPEDFFGISPQFVIAQNISDDGNTISGSVLDGKGDYSYPIIFTKSDSGDWDYSLPTADLFNPTGIDIPENPWQNEPAYPDPEKYIDPLLKPLYDQAYQDYLDGKAAEPNPANYMSDEGYEEYKAAVEYYNEWWYSSEERFDEYNRIYRQVLETTVGFPYNDQALVPSGEYMYCQGIYTNSKGVTIGSVYQYDRNGTLMRELETPNPLAYPHQVLTDGTLIVTLPIGAVPVSWILFPGEEEFISVVDYLEPDYPELVEFLEDNYEGRSGIASFSDDMTILTAGVIPWQLTIPEDQLDPDDESEFVYTSYLFKGLKPSAGIEAIVAPEANGIFKAYNISGVKVLETKDANEINNLPKGIYIVNGKKVFVK